MKPQRSLLPILCAVLLNVPVAGLVRAQDAAPGPATSGPQDPRPGVFGDIVEVRVVNVEVVVTDADDLRVSGLGIDDFRILVDGEPVRIDYFSEIFGGRTVAPQPAVALPGEDETPGVPALQPGEQLGTSYLVFVDEFFSITNDRDKVLEALIEDLPLLGPADRMAIVAFDGRELTMLSSWSQSAGDLENALQKATRRPAYGLQRITERRNFRTGIPVPDSGELRRTGRLDVEEEQYALQLVDQVERVVSAAAATLRSFAQPPGRKVMLVLSGGWPYVPAEYVTADEPRALVDRLVAGGPQLYRPLSDTANRLGYTLYPVDVPGLQSELVDAGAESPGSIAGNFSDGFLREQEIHTSLTLLAEETGGRPLLNSGRLDALPRVVEDTRSFYWLGFTPDWRGDDEVHDVRVELTGSDREARRLDLRARDSYLDLSVRRERSMQVESALLFGNSPSALPLQVELSSPQRAGWGKMKLDLKVWVPAHQVAMVPVEDKYVTQLELRIAALDETGGRSEVPVVPLQVVFDAVPTEPTALTYSTPVTLRRKQQDLVVAVVDTLNGTVFSTRVTVRP